MLPPPDVKARFDVSPAIYPHGFPLRIPLTGRQPLLHVPLESVIILWPHTLSLLSYIHTCVLRFTHVGTEKMLRLFDPGAPYLFTPQVAHTSLASCVEEQQDPLALFLQPRRSLRLVVGRRNFFWIINVCRCTPLLFYHLRSAERRHLRSFIQLLCTHFADIKIPESSRPLNRCALCDQLLCLSTDYTNPFQRGSCTTLHNAGQMRLSELVMFWSSVCSILTSECFIMDCMLAGLCEN